MRHLEDQECFKFKNYLDLLVIQKKITKYSHLAQETYTPFYSVRSKNSKLGVKSGVPDYIITIEKSKYGDSKLIFIEMKKTKGGKATQQQLDWLVELNKVSGVEAFIANGFFEAKTILDNLI